jgi:iron complex outermembrane receptor protein
VTSISTQSRTRLRTSSALRSLALAGAGLASVFAAPAFAQDATTQPSDTAPQAATPAPTPAPASGSQDIVVTGTLFRNASAATASPVTVLSSQDLANRGINTVSDAIQQLSANNGGTLNTNWGQFGFPKGASAPSLRGLTDGRTLTIFDGLRSAVYPLADDGYRNFVDTNTIPDSIVDRVEVLQDGASATYGADAVAGVINIIVKKEITGLHLNASGGISQRGDAGQQRIDGTYGYGKLDEQGFNFYINGEYQNDDPLYLRDRGAPYGTANHSDMCGTSIVDGSKTCRSNGIANGIQFDGTYGGLSNTTAPATRPYNSTALTLTDPLGVDHTFAPGTVALGPYQYANGCGNLPSQGLTGAQRGSTTPTWTPVKDANGNITSYTFNNVNYTGAVYPSSVCQQDLTNQYYQYSGRVQHLGANAHLTVNIGSRAQAYAMFNWYQTRTANPLTPLSYNGQTAAGGTQVTVSPILLPVYVCPRGFTGTCDASNGTLNPQNPFAGQGEEARVQARLPVPTEDDTLANSFRYTAGIAGSFGNDWNYKFDATHSDVYLRYTSSNYINARHLLNVIADGSYNFFNPSANSAEETAYLTPTVVNNSVSRLTQVEGSLSHGFFNLPGGPFQVAIGGAWRKESIHNPSSNPANETDPYDRYYSINAVGVEGSRTVWSGFFQVDAPVLSILDLGVSGRYDSYSSGQKNFSPKFEAQFKPIEQIKIRGTYSKGFAIPSFNEAYGLPTTGYITTQLGKSAADQAFIAAHGGDDYATQSYSYGLTSIGNPSVKPEKSTSWTAGVVLEPTHWLTLTADYYNITVKDLITTPNCSAVVEEYYANNGVTSDPTCVTSPGVPDSLHPNALPLLGTITSYYTNANSLKSRGFDFTGTARIPLGNIHWTSAFNATLMTYLAKIDNDGTVERYDGTLGPCEITSCSGSPKFKGSWQNTLDFNGKGTLSATVNYTSGYNLEGADDGGIPGDCLNSIGAEIVTYRDGATPVSCHTPRFVTVDMTGSIKVANEFTLYANVLNLFDAKAPFDPSAGYGLYQFNPAWAGSGFIGRYFRVGAKVDF